MNNVKKQTFTAYGTLELDISTKVSAVNETGAYRQAANVMDDMTIGAVMLTIVHNDGNISTFEVHNWQTKGIDAIYGQDE